MRAVREGWWSRWGEHFCGRGIKKGFIRRVEGSRMNLCGVSRGSVGAYCLRSTSQGATPWCLSVRPSVGDFGRRWGLIVCGVRAKARRRGACRCARQWVISGGVGAYRLRSTSQGATPWCLSVRPLVGDFGRRWGLIVCGARAKGRRRGACRCARQWVISGGVGVIVCGARAMVRRRGACQYDSGQLLR